MTNHDGSYKNIFSHPEIIADLLSGFVHEDWVAQIDYSTLEKVSGSYIADDLRDRADDIVWRVKRNDDWLYVYLLIEFQSRVDPWMALRIMVYTGLLYQDLIKSGVVSPHQKLPPVFPIVIYNGEGKWSAAQDIAELIEPIAGSLATYRPSQKHFVLDEGRVVESDFPTDQNTLAEIIRLESSPEPEAMRNIVARLTILMQNPRHDSLRRALVVWINRVVLKRLVPEENIPEVTNLQEIDAMLAERVVQWTEKWKQQGLQQGMQQGELAILERMLARRFGPLNEVTLIRLRNATHEQIECWADAFLEAKTLDDVFSIH
jgi:predicted transposase/invertase (TIGR01784 family)